MIISPAMTDKSADFPRAKDSALHGSTAIRTEIRHQTTYMFTFISHV